MSSSRVETTPLAESVEVTDAELIVRLVDGRRVSVPLVWFPRLRRATPEQRGKTELLGDGDGIHWPLIDEDLSVEGLLSGRRSRSPNLEERSAVAQEGFQHKLAQKDKLRTSELATARNEFGEQKSLWEKERASFQKAWKTVRQIAADASEAQHVLRQCDSEEKLADANRRVDRFMQDCTDWCKETYEPLWGSKAPCRVLVKYLVDENNMSLMFRDRQSGRVDKGARRRRRIDQYTSYGDIYHDRRPYFFSHDLVALAANDGYSNPKENWQDLYKTELVVPIGKLDTSDGCGRDLVGFLAIASLKTNIMDEERDLEIALTIASHMYDVLAALYAVKRAWEQEQESKGGAVEEARRIDSRKGELGNASA